MDSSSEPLLLGIDMGASNIRASVVAADGTVLETVQSQLPDDPGQRAVAPVTLAARFADRVAAVGLAVAGTVVEGKVTWTANLGLADMDYRRRIEAEAGLPTLVVNDASAAAVAEARVGAGTGTGVLLVITVGTGIGGSVLIGGRLVEGTGHAGEVGHLVMDRSGPQCGCGRNGCWETLVGGKALTRIARGMFPDAERPLEQLVRSAEAGAPRAIEIIERAQDTFRLGLDNLAAVLAPEVIVLGGGIIARGGLVAERYLACDGFRWFKGELRRSLLGDLGGQIGAALLAASSVGAGVGSARPAGEGS